MSQSDHIPVVLLAGDASIVAVKQRLEEKGLRVVLVNEENVLTEVRRASEISAAQATPQQPEARTDEPFFEHLFHHSPVAVVMVDETDRVRKCNAEFTRLFGYESSDAEGQLVNDLIVPAQMSEDGSELSRQVLTGNRAYRETVRRRKDGALIDVAITGAPLAVQGRRYAFAIYQDITARRLAERARQRLERFVRGVLNALPDSIAVLDETGTILMVNESCQRFARDNGLAWPDYGVGRNYLTESGGRTDSATEATRGIGRVVAGEQQHLSLEYPCHSASEQRWFLMRASRFATEDGPRTVVIHTNITERKQAEQQISELLGEKELLLRETHHRVKNNLGVIRGLLALEGEPQEGTSSSTILQDAASRVGTMMTLYDRLYRSGEYRDMSLRDYLPSLVAEIMRQFESASSVETVLRIDDVVLGAKTLSPLGIMITEMITNSMKHAFTAVDAPRIELVMQTDGAVTTLTYADNGVGLPDSVSATAPESFGLRLIHLLADQIGASLRVHGDAGTSYTITLPNGRPRGDRDLKAGSTGPACLVPRANTGYAELGPKDGPGGDV